MDCTRAVRLMDEVEPFTAELYALCIAVRGTKLAPSPDRRFVVLCDSLEDVRALSTDGPNSACRSMSSVRQDIHQLMSGGYDVRVTWALGDEAYNFLLARAEAIFPHR